MPAETRSATPEDGQFVTSVVFPHQWYQLVFNGPTTAVLVPLPTPKQVAVTVMETATVESPTIAELIYDVLHIVGVDDYSPVELHAHSAQEVLDYVKEHHRGLYTQFPQEDGFIIGYKEIVVVEGRYVAIPVEWYRIVWLASDKMVAEAETAPKNGARLSNMEG